MLNLFDIEKYNEIIRSSEFKKLRWFIFTKSLGFSYLALNFLTIFLLPIGLVQIAPIWDLYITNIYVSAQASFIIFSLLFYIPSICVFLIALHIYLYFYSAHSIALTSYMKNKSIELIPVDVAEGIPVDFDLGS